MNEYSIFNELLHRALHLKLTNVVLREFAWLDVAGVLGALVEEHAHVLLAHVLLDLLDPLQP